MISPTGGAGAVVEAGTFVVVGTVVETGAVVIAGTVVEAGATTDGWAQPEKIRAMKISRIK
jgi:carbonic anhydrase/acetyltransferase-like protein (isoleucine patch superfamily)